VGGLDENGMPIAWRYQAATTSIYARLFPPLVRIKNDPAIAQGATELAYALPNYSMEGSSRDFITTLLHERVMTIAKPLI
jgi:hypothetical protein